MGNLMWSQSVRVRLARLKTKRCAIVTTNWSARVRKLHRRLQRAERTTWRAPLFTRERALASIVNNQRREVNAANVPTTSGSCICAYVSSTDTCDTLTVLDINHADGVNRLIRTVANRRVDVRCPPPYKTPEPS